MSVKGIPIICSLRLIVDDFLWFWMNRLLLYISFFLLFTSGEPLLGKAGLNHSCLRYITKKCQINNGRSVKSRISCMRRIQPDLSGECRSANQKWMDFLESRSSLLGKLRRGLRNPVWLIVCLGVFLLFFLVLMFSRRRFWRKKKSGKAQGRCG